VTGEPRSSRQSFTDSFIDLHKRGHPFLLQSLP
jgi:hypothetical protein